MKVALGRVVGAHGLRGQLRVRCLGDDPGNLLAAASIELADARGAGDPAPQRCEIREAAAGRAGEVRLRLAGVDDRNAALALRGQLLLGDSADLAALPEGEFYWFQLIGCRVERAGRTLGRVREIWETGAHDVLVVSGCDGRERLIPTARELMPEVDLAARRIAIADLPGLGDPAAPAPSRPRRVRTEERGEQRHAAD
ncbi:MAG: ribosome maturation factor RimM [Deltaproteobacteria bacterium]|nr:ribosome maturation factor RimM [Deltaproteobacteria bacterium]MDD9827449.1 ribosome maturation factor RimM [Deltaproteobacteria bacterium]MDD9854021.1 ribosome maturation factor RimM [Deltaproteobacteria bacterium]MDD9872995.1 ribosome maturation factor RimM [Deltaproteobacteria bacterium]